MPYLAKYSGVAATHNFTGGPIATLIISFSTMQLSRTLEHDTLVVVFPLWWYSFPAMLKGYIDRVWNNGLAYGDGHKLPFNKVRWVALVGGDKESFVQMGWEKNISDYLKNMCSYLGIEDADVTFLCNTVVFDGEELHASYYQSLLSQVRDMVDAL